MIEQDAGGALAKVQVPMLVGNARGLVEQGRRFIQSSSAPAVVLDLASVAHADSSALAVIFSWMRAGKSAGKTIRLAQVPSALSSLASLYGVGELLARVAQP